MVQMPQTLAVVTEIKQSSLDNCLFAVCLRTVSRDFLVVVFTNFSSYTSLTE